MRDTFGGRVWSKARRKTAVYLLLRRVWYIQNILGAGVDKNINNASLTVASVLYIVATHHRAS